MKPSSKQGGQALVEYILILVVVVGLALLVGRSLFTPLKKWTDFYMGTYTQCMLDSGTLPAIAGGSTTDCSKQALDAGVAPGQQTNSSSNSPTENAQKQAQAAAAQRAAQQASRGRGGGGRAGGRSGGGGGRGFNEISSVPKGAEASEDSNVTVVSTNADKLLRRAGRSRKASEVETQIRARGIHGNLDEAQISKLRGEEKITKIDTDNESGRKPKKVAWKPSVRKTASSEDDTGMALGFGGFFRIAIIVIVIIGIIYVVGSQLNSISKSMDK